jgi:hypothetical protein
MFRLRTMLTSDDALWRANPNLEYVDPNVRALWEQLAQLAVRAPTYICPLVRLNSHAVAVRWPKP